MNTQSQHQIFISYRHGPDEHAAGRVHDYLASKFEPRGIFFDRHMQGGDLFPEATLKALWSVPVILAVIGKGWISSASKLEDPHDWVRRELEAALSRGSGVWVFPVLLDGLTMPDLEQLKLPSHLGSLCNRQARRLGTDNWDGDIDLLMRDIRRAIAAVPGPPGAPATSAPDKAQRRPRRWSGWVITALLVSNLIALAMAFLGPPWLPIRGGGADYRPISPGGLGLGTFYTKMPCELPLQEKQAKAITFHNSFIRNSKDCKYEFADALTRGVKLRFLVLDPLSPATEMRVNEFPPGAYMLQEYRQKIREYVEALLWVADKFSQDPGQKIDDTLQVHVYHDLPGTPIYIVQVDDSHDDDVIYQGLFLVYRNGSDDLPAAEYRRPVWAGADPVLFNELRAYVDNKWGKSTPLSFAALRACLGDAKEEDQRWYDCIHDVHSHGASAQAPASPAGPAAGASR